MNKKSLPNNKPLRFLLHCAVLMTVMMTSFGAMAQNLNGSGTANDPYLIGSDDNFATFVANVNNDTQGDGAANACYKITANINASDIGEITRTFTGHLTSDINDDTHRPYTITNLGHRMFTTVDGAEISNIMLKNVEISQAGYVGAICGTANGATRIFNCGILPNNAQYTDTSSVASTNSYCGSLVGFLDGYARVINCFSFANIDGGTVKGGIVGYNNYASTYATGNPAVSNIHTMVMNCMFYGNIDFTSGSVYPIYGGEDISNEGTSRLNNYNYFLYESKYSEKKHITAYNHALAAEKHYLERWEFYRYLVNSTRELASWYVYGSVQADAQTKMLKWVLDKSIAPYPILKQQDSYTPGAYLGTGLYPSVVNYDPEYTFNPTTGAKVSRSSVTTRNQGGKLTSMGTNGSLSVNISMPATATGGQGKPSGAALNITSRSLPIIDKDTALFNFNYGKVQLPYYNEVGTGNYTGNKVVTGWMITDITAVSGDPYTAANYTGENYDSPYYNFADRKSSNKDKYAISGRVFSQGAYFDVPDGVTSITIEPYWGYAAYLSDEGYDAYYTNGGTGNNNNWRYNVNSTVDIFGRRYTNNSTVINNDNTQKVRTSFSNALKQLDALGRSTSTSIYDYAVVLVGNYHQKGMPENSEKHFTVMSVDLNYDNEPDYSLIIHSGKQEKVSPIRFDFINVPNAAMAHKLTSYTYMGILGNIKPKGWFETTNTTTIRFSQYEYDSENKTLNEPLILMGGLIDMFTSTNGSAASTHTNYMIVGGNVWFKVFNIGCHMDKTYATPHRPISVCGGDYNKFYLSGYLKPSANAYTTNDGGQNAECYVSGGCFGEVAGAGYVQIKGNVTWQIYDADMESFYGGGINDGKPVTGNITTTIRGGRIGLFCGGPKFGNMSTGKTVETTATDCIFGTFFGAGYGGTAFTRVNSYNHYNTLTYNWNGSSEGEDIVPEFTKSDGPEHRGNYVDKQGIAVNYEYENFEGSSINTVAYLFVNYASLSVARCNNVTSTLTACTIERNYYGGGSLGSVIGDATSNLHNCTVHGNAFGAGYSADIPTVKVFPDGDAGLFQTIPVYNSTTGVFEKGVFPTPVVYKWSDKGDDSNTLVDDEEGHWIHTGVDLNTLGTVSGNVTLNLTGNTTVEGKIFNDNGTVAAQTGGVYGGGDESGVTGTDKTVEVNINTTSSDHTTKYINNVFGGGNKANVAGTVALNIGPADGTSPYILHDVYGGGALAHVNVTATTSGSTTTYSYTPNTTTTVTLTKGTVDGDVYGGGLGQTTPTSIEAKVYGPVQVNFNGGQARNVFGCNNVNGAPQNTVTVDINNGTVTTDVFGGGNLAHNALTPVVNINGGTVGQDVYGGGALADVGGSLVNVLGGTVTRNVYGGGLGDDTHEPAVDGEVIVNIGAAAVAPATDPTGDAIINGSVYGCNNANGTPTDNVTVNIYKTYRESNQETSGTDYALYQVFGGGNQANYEPDADKAATVHIWTCDNTIQYVYGGGNAADLGTSSVNSATDVIIDGGRIEWVFGGGNGYSETHNHNDPTAANYNPGANIFGNTNVTFHAGDITYIFGGSNQYGNVSGTKTVNILADGDCETKHIAELYGGSNEAPTEGDVSLTMGCQPNTCEIGALFGGSRNADIGTGSVPANVELTVNGGVYDYVFGGNNIGGTIYGNVTLNLNGGTINEAAFGGNRGGGSIMGNITVNVEDKGFDCPLEVKDVFGAGDQAMYTAPTGTGASEFNPVVNINHLRTGKTITGNVYGGGNGDPGNSSQEPGMVTGHPKVIIGDMTTGHENYRAVISGNVYGGGNAAKVVGTTNVLMQQANSAVALDIYGGGNLANVSGTTNININGGTVTQDVYGGGALANTGGSNVTLGGGTVRDIYGGGLGRNASSGITAIPAQVTGPVTVTVNNGSVRDVFGCNNINGAPTNTVQVNINNNVTRNVYGGGNLAASTVAPDVNIIAGTVSGSVFGGGNQAGVGGGDVAMTGGTVLTGIYGGCNTSGTVSNNIVVSLTGGTIGADGTPANVHGGGYGEDTKTGGNVEVTIDQQSGSNPPAAPVIWGDVYGGSALGSVNSSAATPAVNSSAHTYVTLNKGTVHGDIYGGGLGQTSPTSIEAKVWSPVQVTVNGGTVTGSIYGCNNVNGAPQSTVKVDINGTDAPASGYALANVFGGGNLAAYGGTPEVTIHNCDNSIGFVYGGGNAASVAATNVKVYGGNTIGYVFGGGNGEGVAANFEMVSGNAVAYIYGGTIDHVFGGNNSSGAINGSVTLNINKQAEGTGTACAMKIGEVYGGGNYAAGNAGTINIGCTGDLVTLGTGQHYGVDQEGIRYVYGGANQAGINNNIVLNINSGIIENVFGGNNQSGNIRGTITVNIEKNASATCANNWYIGNVYGGGNQALYSPTTTTNNPSVNIKNGTVSGDVFGGGLGASAKVRSNPIVTVGDPSNNAYAAVVSGNVYGGGSAAMVGDDDQTNPSTNNTTMLIQKSNSQVTKVFGGGKEAGVTGTTGVTITDGTITGGVYGGCDSQGNVTGKITVDVKGGTFGSASNLALTPPVTVDVYGGGYGPSTTTSGDVEVNIGECTSSNEHSDFPKIYGDVYGGSAFGKVNSNNANTTTVNVLNGTLFTHPESATTTNGQPYSIYHGGNVYGGGLGDKPSLGMGHSNVLAEEYGKIIVNIGASGSAKTLDPTNDTYIGEAIIEGNIYGCNNTNGSPQDDVTVNIYRTHRGETDEITYTPTASAPATFALNDVFGGGNQADYNPTATGKKSSVLIHGCYNTVERVFGGSNAAASGTPASGANAAVPVEVHTNINGGRFKEVFGGGNGEVSVANIIGDVRLEIHGGTVGEFYVGSNQQGSISGNSNVTVDQNSGCEQITITEFYCGGKYANFMGNINATITCSEGMNVTNLYGGCKEAHVFGNIHLTVKGGTFENVYGGSRGTEEKGADVQGNVVLDIFGGTVTNAIFGGSNVKGAIGGTITVNVEQKTGADYCPLDVSLADVYGGGNKAAYPGTPESDGPISGSVSTTSNYPAVNIKNATVKNVFGGGLEAEVKGNPQIQIKQHARILGNVYGGGNMGKVTGNPRVIVNGKQVN